MWPNLFSAGLTKAVYSFVESSFSATCSVTAISWRGTNSRTSTQVLGLAQRRGFGDRRWRVRCLVRRDPYLLRNLRPRVRKGDSGWKGEARSCHTPCESFIGALERA